MVEKLKQRTRRYTAWFDVFYFLFCSLVKEVGWKVLKISYLKSLVESYAVFLDQISSNLKKATLNIFNTLMGNRKMKTKYWRTIF